MSSTDGNSAKLAAAFFDEVLEPLARRRQSAGLDAYFPMGPAADAASYFELPFPVARMSAADFEFPGHGTTSGLIEALASHWAAEGEISLAKAAPRLQAIADALAEANKPQSADVDIFCYTLF